MAASRRAPSPNAPTPPTLRVEQALKLLATQIEEGGEYARGSAREEPDEWTTTTRAYVIGAFGDHTPALRAFDDAASGIVPFVAMSDEQEADHRRGLVVARIAVLKSLRKQLEAGLGGVRAAPPPATEAAPLRTQELREQLTFLVNPQIQAIVLRDIDDLDRVLRAEAWKSAMLLAGSILEGVLIDVLDRNRSVASTYMKKQRFPEEASLGQLIKIASDPALLATDPASLEGVPYLLSSTSADLAGAVTEHRDLIHPVAEVNARIVVDRATADAMVRLVHLIVRDLSRAEEAGAIRAYADK